MVLYINTADFDFVEIGLKTEGKMVFSEKIKARYAQGEKLVLSIDKMLAKKNIDKKKITAIEVENQGGSYTSLRVGAVAANAMGYALSVPVNPVLGQAKKSAGVGVDSFDIVMPDYGSEPTITTKKINK